MQKNTAALILIVSSFAEAQETQPNIVFFFSDDLTTQAISAYRYGLELPPTPNIDRLADEGMLFGDELTVADILLTHTLIWAVAFKQPLTPRAQAYCDRLSSRTALQSARDKEAAAVAGTS